MSCLFIGGDLAPSLGDGTKVRGPNFRMTIFRKQISILPQKNFWRFFSHRLSILCLSSISILSALIYNIYDPFPYQKVQFQRKRMPPRQLFFVSSHFASLPITVLLKILRGRIHGMSPTSNFVGTVPQSPQVSAHVSDNSSSQNIGGTDTWAVPHLKFGGHRPPSPPKSPPMFLLSKLIIKFG